MAEIVILVRHNATFPLTRIVRKENSQVAQRARVLYFALSFRRQLVGAVQSLAERPLLEADSSPTQDHHGI